MMSIKQQLDQNIAQLTHADSPWAVAKTQIDGVEYKYYPKAPKTLLELMDQGRLHGEAEFIIYQDERWTYQDFFKAVDALAWQLQHNFKIQAGDKIAIAMRNYPEWMIAFAAIAYAGAVVVPLNSWGKQKELEYGLKDAQAKIAFFDQQRFDYVADQLDDWGIQAIVARSDISSQFSSVYSIQNLYQTAESKKPTLVQPEEDELAMIMYTAGTTGDAKGVMATHRGICQAIYNFELAGIAAAMSNGDVITKMLERGYAAKNLLSVPLFHVSGCYSVFLLSLRANRPIVIMHKWDVKTALEIIENERVTTVYAVPSMLMALLESDLWERYDTSSLFAFGAGGSAQPPHLAKLIYQRLPDSFPGTGYGMTETNAAGFASTGAAYAYKPYSCGTATPIVEVKITDDKGQLVAEGKDGNIWLKAPSVAKGYWNKPQATADTFQQGWVNTGDIGYIDDEGFLYITDRSKDLVIRGGENISTVEVESVALAHPAIEGAAAFGVADDILGEELALAVVFKPEQAINEQVLQAYLAESLAQFKVPSKIFIRDSLPRNATHKVVKSELKKQYS